MDSFLKFSNLVFPNLKNHIYLIPPASVASSSLLYDQQQQHWKKSQQQISKVDEELDYYEILGVSQDSDEQQIRSAYKQLAKQLHPDHLQLHKNAADSNQVDESAVETSFEINLREEAEMKMSELNEAFSVLNDPQRRKMYDFKILQRQQSANNASTKTRSTTSFVKSFSRQKLWDNEFRTEKEEKSVNLNIEHDVSVSLEDLYLGKSKKFEIIKQVVCKTCSGYGCINSEASTSNIATDESETTEITCKICQGRGSRKIQWDNHNSFAKSHQLWRLSTSSTASATIVDCSYCSGKGSLPNKSTTSKKNTICQCHSCKGAGVLQETQVIKVKIEKGMQNGDQIVKKGFGDEMLNTKLNQIINGDLILRLCQKPHIQFSRKGSHLFLQKKINLQEAATGFQFSVKHLDGRELLIEQKAMLHEKESHCIVEEGIPKGQGNLYIHYQIT